MVIVKILNYKKDDSFRSYRGKSAETIVKRVFGANSFIEPNSKGKPVRNVYKKTDEGQQTIGVVSTEMDAPKVHFPSNAYELIDLLYEFRENRCKFCASYDNGIEECTVATNNRGDCTCRNGITKYFQAVTHKKSERKQYL